jgi:tetratricopeptide (TPR) repeat protein
LERLEASLEGAQGIGAQTDHAGQEGTEAEALRRAHAVYYLRLAEEHALAMVQPEAAIWLERLEREHDNFRAALAWARERGEVELGLRLAGSLGPFWDVRGYRTEGRGWLEGLLAALAPWAAADKARTGDVGGAGVSAAARAKALVAASNFAWRLGDDQWAQAAAAEGLALAPDQQAGWAAGMALNMLGVIAWDRGDLEQATAYLEESVARLRAAGELGLAAAYRTTMGAVALDQGDLERATACCEESLTFARRTGADYAAGFALAGLADVARRRGNLARAEVLGREKLQIWRRLGVSGYLAWGLENLALTAAAGGEGARAARAARLLGAAARLRERVGAPLRRRQWQSHMERGAALARAALGEERWTAAFSAGEALELEEAIAEALDSLL